MTRERGGGIRVHGPHEQNVGEDASDLGISSLRAPLVLIAFVLCYRCTDASVGRA